MRVLIIHPGATISTKDVFDGVVTGLSAAGADCVLYALQGRIGPADDALHAAWRVAKKEAKRKNEQSIPRPGVADVCYAAAIPVFEKLYAFRPEVVLLVSGVLVVKRTIELIRTQHTVGVILTESPYLMTAEQRIAEECDLAWTNERRAVATLRERQPYTQYLPHAWLPGRHDVALATLPETAAHDVVFVGTGFPERIALLEAVDWTGIDLGLYGNWTLSDTSPLRPFLKSGPISNEQTTALYRRAKIGLNHYRTTTDTRTREPLTFPAESLNPRAYELAAAGVCTVSTPRLEVSERFGDLVPTFRTATELTDILRRLLIDDEERQRLARQLPACVAADTWLARGRQLLTDLQQWRQRAA